MVAWLNQSKIIIIIYQRYRYITDTDYLKILGDTSLGEYVTIMRQQ